MRLRNVSGTALAELMALVTTMSSALFLASSGLLLSPENIAQLQGAYLGWNSHYVRALADQAADTRVGVLLLLTAFALQGWALWRVASQRVRPLIRRNEVAAAALLFLLVLTASLNISACHSQQIYEETMSMLKEKSEKGRKEYERQQAEKEEQKRESDR